LGDSLAAANSSSAGSGSSSPEFDTGLPDTAMEIAPGRNDNDWNDGVPTVYIGPGGGYAGIPTGGMPTTAEGRPIDALGRVTGTIGSQGSVVGMFADMGIDQRAGYGQLLRTGQLTRADFDAKGTPIVQPGQTFTIDPNDLTSADGRLGGSFISTESVNRAAILKRIADEQAAQVASDYATSDRISMQRANAAINAPSTAGLMSQDEMAARYFANGVGRTSTYQAEQQRNAQMIAVSLGGGMGYDASISDPLIASGMGNPMTAAIAQPLAQATYDAGENLLAAYNNPEAAMWGGAKRLVNLGPDLWNAANSAVKFVGQGYVNMAEVAGLLPAGSTDAWRDAESTLHITPLATINGRAEAGGALMMEAALTVLPGMSAARPVEFIDVTRPMTQLNSMVIPLPMGGTTRITTVTREMSDAYQGLGYLNPMTNTFKAAPVGKTMAVDHIFPSARIVDLPGFKTLTNQQMTNILQDRIGLGNLQPLPKTFNSSKGSSVNWATYKGQNLDTTYRMALTRQQADLEIRIQSQIRAYQQQNAQLGR
jgi:hypothetical protein